jgi:putative tryptophan/tyrosine transport system substrate-binding protein
LASLNRPGGNVTGITAFGTAAVTKRVQLMHELIPKAATIAYLMNPNHPSGEIEMRAAQTAARSLGKEMLVLKASNEREFDPAFAAMAHQQVGALLVASDAFFYSRRGELVSLVARHGVPAIYYLPEFVRAENEVSPHSSKKLRQFENSLISSQNDKVIKGLPNLLPP